MKTKKVVDEFGELLAKVHPDLVSGYERIRADDPFGFDDKTLQQANEEYLATQKRLGYLRKVEVFSITGLIVGGMIAAFTLSPASPSSLRAIVGVMFLLSTAMSLLSIQWISNNEGKRDRIHKELEKFRRALAGFDMAWMPASGVSSSRFHNRLVHTALEVIFWEGEYDRVRRLPERHEKLIRENDGKMMQYRSALVSELAQAKLFGLEFDREEIYREAGRTSTLMKK